MRLLQLEADIRRCESLTALIHHCANESRPLLGFRQAFVLQRRGRKMRVAAVSSVSVVEPNAPLVRQVEGMIRAHERDGQIDGLSDVVFEQNTSGDSYPFPNLIWVPFLSHSGKAFAGLLIANERPFPEKRRAVAERLGETYRHAWLALTKGAVSSRRPLVSRLAILLALAGLAAMIFVKVPISAIAPVEVVARDAAPVTAALDGVVKEIAVRPNQPVEAGSLLVRFEDTELRNAADIAQQQVVVAQSRVNALSTGAFGDRAARRDIAIARAELDLAQAEHALALERLQRTELRAATPGLAVFDDAGSWRGRPVSIGEKIMEIADPDRIEYAIALPVDDLIALDRSKPARIFLDSAPLQARTGEISRASYHATQQGDGLLAYELRAVESSDTRDLPRIGARGTAQVMGQDARLGFVLFRRPIVWIRQTFGL